MSKEAHTANPETLLRFHRRSMIFLLLMITAIGAFLTASALWPEAGLLRWVERAPFFFPMMIIIAVAVQQTSMRKHRLALDTPEYKALMSDEWRLKSMDRASRGALIIVLIAQFFLPLIFVSLPTLRAVWGMAAATVTVGAASQIGLFLLFDRD